MLPNTFADMDVTTYLLQNMRKSLLYGCFIILFVSTITALFAQPAILSDSAISISDPRGYYNPQLLRTADGGHLVGQSSAEDAGGLKSQNSKGFYDYWIGKYSASGKKQWDKTIGGSESDLLRTFIQTADGGYLLAGESYSGISGDKTGEVVLYADYWIFKLSANGAIEWDKTIGTHDNDSDLEDIKQTTDGDMSYWQIQDFPRG